MMRRIRPISKLWICKTCVSGEAAYPITMQKGVEMFGGMSLTQMIDIRLPHSVMGWFFQL